jgi:acyl dehydratase
MRAQASDMRDHVSGESKDDLRKERTAWPNGAPVVGQRAERSRMIDGHDIELFTAISGDRNPLHYDAALASRTRFGGIVVQGGITSAILNAVVAEDLPGPGTVFLNVNWSFKAPVRPGDTITGQVEITRVRDDKPITELVTRVVRGDGTVVLDGTAVCYTFAIGAEPAAAPDERR